ncbi:hypothetical protein P4O66_017893 [Electrophorus voltai]|uniref:Uncharacterized protein n=1 Tax=Electrophorus voltai TaxID=2609070 RepID=A0AAD8YRZ2_9TELE|nr:hypothetical protein P4O66_017893 [Electrophorus voltai]
MKEGHELPKENQSALPGNRHVANLSINAQPDDDELDQGSTSIQSINQRQTAGTKGLNEAETGPKSGVRDDKIRLEADEETHGVNNEGTVPGAGLLPGLVAGPGAHRGSNAKPWAGTGVRADLGMVVGWGKAGRLVTWPEREVGVELGEEKSGDMLVVGTDMETATEAKGKTEVNISSRTNLGTGTKYTIGMDTGTGTGKETLIPYGRVMGFTRLTNRHGSTDRNTDKTGNRSRLNRNRGYRGRQGSSTGGWHSSLRGQKSYRHDTRHGSGRLGG